LKKFYNRKLCGIGATIDAIYGFAYLNEYYQKKIFNSFANELNKLGSIEKSKNDDT